MKSRTLFAAIAAMSVMVGLGCQTTQRTEPAPQQDQPQRTTSRFPSMHGGGLKWSWLAYPTGDPSSSALGVEKGVPTEVRLNQPFEYQIVVTNLTNMSLSEVVVQDQLGQNFKFNSSNPETTPTNGGVLTWALGDMGPGESRTIKVNATATKAGQIASCATATYNSALCASIPVVEPKLKIVKSGPAEALKCDEIVYTFDVTNTGTGAIDSVTVNDRLPDGMTSNGRQDVSFNVDGGLKAGETKKYSMRVTASKTGKFSNMAKATASGGLEAESNEVTTLVKAPKLAIAKSGPERRFVSGSATNITYEIKVTNSGDGVARDTVVRDTVAEGSRFVSATDGGTLTGGQVSWRLGDLAAGASKTVSVTVAAERPGELCNTATAMAYCADNVTAKACTTVEGVPAILLEVVDSPDPIQVGETTTYTITATNQGFALDQNVRIICTIPGAQEYVSSAGATTGTLRGNTLTFAPLSRLEAKQRATWTVTVRAKDVASVRFAVSMSSDNLVGEPVAETEATNQYK
ncbi:MAG: DUF11 domain-containing protein [Phycisphaerales bacterium]